MVPRKPQKLHVYWLKDFKCVRVWKGLQGKGGRERGRKRESRDADDLEVVFLDLIGALYYQNVIDFNHPFFLLI